MGRNSAKEMKDWDAFLDLFLGVNDKAQLSKLFELFMTFSEKETWIRRYRLVKTLLTSELSQREIARLLNVSISKVTAGSKASQRLSPETKAYLIERLSRRSSRARGVDE